MNIGERLKMARLSRGMDLRRLAQEVGVSAQAISKYERNLDFPRSSVLIKLSKSLGTKTDYFFRPNLVEISKVCFRKKVRLSKKAMEQIKSESKEILERYLDIDNLFQEGPSYSVPSASSVREIGDVEDIANKTRQHWSLGINPIENIIELFEDHGIKVLLLDAPEDFDACTFWINNEIPSIVIKKDLPGDRQNFNLTHELGHLILDQTALTDNEPAAYRFAGAFLVPEEVVRRELGNARNSLNFYELHLLKHKYGLSMQGWIYRAKDLGIISENYAKNLFRIFRTKGWHRTEPGDQIQAQEPLRMERLILRALCEDIITSSRASELLGKPLPEFIETVKEKHGGIQPYPCH